MSTDKDYIFVQRLEEACANIRRTPSSICDELGIARSALGYWRKGRCPRVEILNMLANRLNVSAEWLRGVDDVLPLKVVTASPELAEIERIYRSLDLKGKVQLLNFAFELEEKNK